MPGGTKNNVLVTKPSERFQDTRVILIFLVKFEERRVKTLRQEASAERRRDRGVKRTLLSDIFNPKTQNILFETQQRQRFNQAGGF